MKGITGQHWLLKDFNERCMVRIIDCNIHGLKSHLYLMNSINRRVSIQRSFTFMEYEVRISTRGFNTTTSLIGRRRIKSWFQLFRSQVWCKPRRPGRDWLHNSVICDHAWGKGLENLTLTGYIDGKRDSDTSTKRTCGNKWQNQNIKENGFGPPCAL